MGEPSIQVSGKFLSEILPRPDPVTALFSPFLLPPRVSCNNKVLHYFSVTNPSISSFWRYQLMTTNISIASPQACWPTLGYLIRKFSSVRPLWVTPWFWCWTLRQVRILEYLQWLDRQYVGELALSHVLMYTEYWTRPLRPSQMTLKTYRNEYPWILTEVEQAVCRWTCSRPCTHVHWVQAPW